MNNHLVLAGGGHVHALLLLKWCLRPELKPPGLITLVSRNSSTIYSGMLPELIAGKCKLDDCLINLDAIASQAKISFIRAEIIGIDIENNKLNLLNRPALTFDAISINVGSETADNKYKSSHIISHEEIISRVRPLESTMAWINYIDQNLDNNIGAVTVVGSGLSAIEIVFALRTRWPDNLIQLQTQSDKLSLDIKKTLNLSRIRVISPFETIKGPCLLCTGSKGPEWLGDSGLLVNSSGRVVTRNTLQAVNYPRIFAVGDCGVIANEARPPSGVWAVRLVKPLARNLQLIGKGLPTQSWKPQRFALQLMGANLPERQFVAWAFWGNFIFGPNFLLGVLKKFLDKRFIKMFNELVNMKDEDSLPNGITPCRGCAAKLPENTLKNALKKADLNDLVLNPADASVVTSFSNEDIYLQSVDGFPALLSDPWLNARLTTLHACSDILASGAKVLSAQAIIALPQVSFLIQEELLTQSLLGIKSALEEQGAKLIGGHSLETRGATDDQIGLGLNISLNVNGLLPNGFKMWPLSGLQTGDILLISRGIGSGVIFAASMAGKVNPNDLDKVISILNESQHHLLEELRRIEKKYPDKGSINACTDITGFGLLGHLIQMLKTTNNMRSKLDLLPLRIELDADSIPSLNGALNLISQGFSSTLSPFNRRALSLLEFNRDKPGLIDLKIGSIPYMSSFHKDILELIVDPQTCGPLLISCPKSFADKLLEVSSWRVIGRVL